MNVSVFDAVAVTESVTPFYGYISVFETLTVVDASPVFTQEDTNFVIYYGAQGIRE